MINTARPKVCDRIVSTTRTARHGGGDVVPFLRCKDHPDTSVWVPRNVVDWMKHHAHGHEFSDLFDIVE